MSNENLMNQFNELLDKYKNTYSEYIDAVNNGESSQSTQQYGEELEKINSKLMNINQQIIHNNRNTVKQFNDSAKDNQSTMKLLLANDNMLQNERAEIARLVHENRSVEEARKESEITTTMYYYHYIIFTFLAILCLFLFFKFSTPISQKGGGGKYFYSDVVFLFSIIFISLGFN